MSTMTSTGSTSSGSARTEADRGRGLRLGGMNWLVWRQHRAAYWTLAAAAAIAVAVMVYQRQQMMTYLDGYDYPHLKEGWEEKFDQAPLNSVAQLVQVLPVLIGVFIGAPLLAGDLESGTAKLVSTQSDSRVRWLTTKLGVTALVVVVCTTAVSAAFTWWWSPVNSSSYVLSWFADAGFDSSGPMPVALTLLNVVAGAAIGMLLRRTLLSMVVTLGFAAALWLVWSHFRMSLGNAVTLTTHNGVSGENSYPHIPDTAYLVDQSYLTASGDTIGWGSCNEATEKATNACLEKAQVVGWSVDYIPMSQFSGMQWLGASILLALTAGIAAFIIFWGRKRVV